MQQKNPYLFLFCSWCPFCLLCLCAEARAQSDLNKPYELRIVVHVARHRLLTDVFRDRIERELRDSLQAGLGDMGHVEVTHKHERLRDVLERGLRSLDEWKDRADVKTHFVLINYSGVHYEIRARQYDGGIGRASPVVRRDRTRDRDFVAKAAALLIQRDFGILGTVVKAPEADGQPVKVELRCGALGNLARWVKKGEVFALTPPGGGNALALKWSLLRVEEPPSEEARDGLCVCRFFHRYKVSDIGGYRCIKLGTVRTPLHLRWMQEDASGAASKTLTSISLSVEIRRHGFQEEEVTKLRARTSPVNGSLDTTNDKNGVFENVAFLSVTAGMAKPLPQIPIALCDDQPIIVDVNANQDPNTLLSVGKIAWQGRVSDSWQVQNFIFRELERMSAKGDKREDILKTAQHGLDRSREDRETLEREKADLLRQAKRARKSLDTAREDRQLNDMANGERQLTDFISAQKTIEATENDPKMKKWRTEVTRAKLLEKDLEIGKALAIYEKIQAEGFQNAKLDARVKELRELWKTENAEHAEARNFIYKVWPTLDSSRLAENLVEARGAYLKCKQARDILSIRKLLKGIEIHADRLTREAKELHPNLITSHEKPAEQLRKVSEALLKLGKDVEAFLKTVQSSEP